MNHVETVGSVYEAFGRGDVASILARLSESVSWDEWFAPGRAQDVLAYLKPRRGRESVRGFFEDVAATLEFHSFEPIGFFASQDYVLARIRFDVTVRPSGKRIQDEEIHLFRFDSSGKVMEFRHYFDTLKHVEALGR
jgi:ketosteroid isomerase-like protein